MTANRSPKTILIAGPTASGKSGLALALAEKLGGTIINADSMQVYRELRVLTARPSAEDEARVPHALYGFVAAADAYSSGRYAADAARAIADAHAAGRVPIVVGGTGLYFKTLLEGLSPIPPIPVDIRTHWRAEAERRGPQELHGQLAARDPETAARLKPTDPQRIVRALEVVEATGLTLSQWQRIPGEPVLKVDETVCLVVSPERAELYRRCDARFEVMMKTGALEEAVAIAALGLDPSLPAMRALGLRPLMQLAAGELTQQDAMVAALAETRHYAKRQLTWLRGNMSAWKQITTQETQSFDRDIIAFIHR